MTYLEKYLHAILNAGATCTAYEYQKDKDGDKWEVTELEVKRVVTTKYTVYEVNGKLLHIQKGEVK